MSRYAIATLLLASNAALVEPDVRVPAGPFQMGCSAGDRACDKDEGPEGGVAVEVPEFFIDKTEVTVAAYRVCARAGKCTVPQKPNNPRDHYCNYGVAGRDEHPVNCVDWHQANAYCAWRGKRLPWEPEWEKAARAGSKTAFPNGQRISCKEAVLNDGSTTGSVAGELDGCGEDRTDSAGSRPPNVLGLHDMHGNVVEWTASWYAPSATAGLYAKGNLRGPAEGERRVARGGAWDTKAANARSSFRDPRKPEQFGGSLGFRCARSP